jgi:hypothetical protein
VALHGEREALPDQIETLGHRLVELSAERTDIAAHLARARAAVDVDEVTAACTRLADLDDVITAVEAQREAGRVRLLAIGAVDGGGQLSHAVQLWQAAQIRRGSGAVLNDLDPTRPEAVADRAAEQSGVTGLA